MVRAKTDSTASARAKPAGLVARKAASAAERVVRAIASVAAEEVVGLIDSVAAEVIPGASVAVVGLGDGDSRTKKVSGFGFQC